MSFSSRHILNRLKSEVTEKKLCSSLPSPYDVSRVFHFSDVSRVIQEILHRELRRWKHRPDCLDTGLLFLCIRNLHPSAAVKFCY